MMSSRTLFAFGLVALAALLCVSAHPAASDAVAEAKDDSETQYFNANNNNDASEDIADVDDLSVSNAPTDSCGAINDVFLFTFDKSALWCAYNDTLIVRMENNPTNRAIAPCQWRSTSCGSYTMIFQNVGSGNKFLTCASNPAKTFCRKISIMNPFADRGQFFVRSTVVGLDTFSSNRFDNKFLADSAGLITLGTSATAFKLCKKSDVATC